jgi:hypothetical protein
VRSEESSSLVFLPRASLQQQQQQAPLPPTPHSPGHAAQASAMLSPRTARVDASAGAASSPVSTMGPLPPDTSGDALEHPGLLRPSPSAALNRSPRALGVSGQLPQRQRPSQSASVSKARPDQVAVAPLRIAHLGSDAASTATGGGLFESFSPAVNGIHYRAAVQEVARSPAESDSAAIRASDTVPAEREFAVTSVDAIGAGGAGRSAGDVSVRAMSAGKPAPRWHRHHTARDSR